MFSTWARLKIFLSRVLARISKIPGQNSNHKIFAYPDLAIRLLPVFLKTTFDILHLQCQKGQFTLQPCFTRWFVRKNIWLLPPKKLNY